MKRKMKPWIFLPLSFALSLPLTLVSCSDGEADKLGQAQACLDKARNAADANQCAQYVQGLTSERAYILSCSIEFMRGGLTSTSLRNAVKTSMNGPSAQKEQNLMEGLIVDGNDVSQAQKTFAACEKSRQGSLIFLSGLSLTATLAKSLFSGDLATGLTNCQGNPTCAAQVGEMAQSVAETYCTGTQAESETCQKFQEAVDQNQGDAGAIGSALLQLLN